MKKADSYCYIRKQPSASNKLLPEIKPNAKIKPAFNKKILSVKGKIDKAIKEITRNEESIKNITYKSWINKITKGEKLFPNEELFAKTIVSKAYKNAEKSTKCLKELKDMTLKMKISLSEKRNKAQLFEGIRRALETELDRNKKRFTIKKPTIYPQKEANIEELSINTARNLLNKSEFQLKSLSKIYRRSSVFQELPESLSLKVL